MKTKYLLLLSISGVVITLDQLSKLWIHTRFELSASFPIISGFFHLTYVRNPGAAFGFLASSHPAFREVFFLSMPPIALLIILAILRSVEERDRWTSVALSLVFGGAIGNYIDRLRFRYVIDFLDFHLNYEFLNKIGFKTMEDLTWPTFNIADVAIVTGICILLFIEFVKHKATKEQAPQT